MERLAKPDQTSDLVAIVTHILSLPRMPTDTLVAFPGLVGEHWRVSDAIACWEQSPGAKHLLIAGEYPHPDLRLQEGMVGVTLKNLQRRFHLRRTEGVYLQQFAHYTHVQADWVSEVLPPLGATSLTLFAAPFHLVRCYLTLLKKWTEKGHKPILMIPSPTPISPFASISEFEGANSWTLVPGEIARIRDYQEKGFIASCDEIMAYLTWLWNNLPTP